MISVQLNGFTVIISDEVQELFRQFRQLGKLDHEAGGILLGQMEGNIILVTTASIPGFGDKSSRFGFERDKKRAQEIIDYQFAISKGTIIYLGEWHTHPEPVPTPSGQDMRMIRGQYNGNKLNEKFILMIIQGTRDLFISFFDGKELNSQIVKNSTQ